MNMLMASMAFCHLDPAPLLGATMAAQAAIVAGSATHELGHWIPARFFGVVGKFKFFPNYGKSALGWVAVMGIVFDDDEIAKLSRSQFRVVVLGGVFFELLFALVCLYWGGRLPGPGWIGCGVAASAVLRPIAVAVNLVPIARARNDGWQFLNPPM
jgi:hypothetical protein